MNEFFKVENDVLSIADNINNKTRLAVDSLTKNQQNIDTYTRLIMKKIYDSLEMNIDEIGMKNSIYEKICRAFYNNALRPEAMLYNGKIVANIITIGIAEHRVIISLNSDEIYLYDSYVTNENLSDLIYRNLQTKEQSNVKPEDLGPTIRKLVVIVKGKMVIIDNVRPCSSISFGFPDKVNGYRDLFRTSYDKILDLLDSKSYTTAERDNKNNYEKRVALLNLISTVLTIPFGATSSTATRIAIFSCFTAINISTNLSKIWNHESAIKLADRTADIDEYRNRQYIDILFTFTDAILNLLNLKNLPLIKIPRELNKIKNQARISWLSIPLGLKNRGKQALAKYAFSKMKFSQLTLPERIKKVKPDGLCHGIVHDLMKRIDNNHNEISTLAEALDLVLKEASGEKQVRENLYQSFKNKQAAANLISYANFNKNSPKIYSLNAKQAMDELQSSLETMNVKDINLLRVYINKADGKTLNIGHVIALQKIDDITYQLFDANTGLYIYKNKETFIKAIIEYFSSAYTDLGKSVPGAWQIYNKIIHPETK